MTFKQQIAKYATGNLTTSQLIDVAVTGLMEGYDSSSLRSLAGLDKNENQFIIDSYFQTTLQELNLNLPEKREAALEYAIGIVDEILENKIDIITGMREIHANAILSCDFYEESKNYCYDSIEFHTAYGLFVTLEDLKESLHPWDKNKTNEQLMAEIKETLLEELKIWKTKIKKSV